MTPTNDTVDQSGADERAKFEAYAKEVGLIYDARGVRTESTVLQLCLDTWNAALASTQPAPQAAQDRNSAIEECARLVESTVETSRGDQTANDGRYLANKSQAGNMIGTTYAAGIRALKTATPQPFPAPAVQSVPKTEAWLIERYDANDKLETRVVLAPLTDDVFLDESSEAIALCRLDDVLPTQAIAQTAPAVAGEAISYPFDLLAVIQWLEAGCDPNLAAKELRIYRDKMIAAPSQGAKQ